MKNINIIALISFACLLLLTSCNSIVEKLNGNQSKSSTTKKRVTSGLFPIKQNNKWGFINKEGKIVIQPQFDLINQNDDPNLPIAMFSEEGLAGVTIGNRSGYIDTTGKFVINPQFESVGNFSEGLAWVVVGKNKIGSSTYNYIDKNGKVVINGTSQVEDSNCNPPKVGDSGKFSITQASEFSEGLAFTEIYCYSEAKKDGYSANVYLDKSGKIAIIDSKFNGLNRFSEGLAFTKLKDQDRYGFIDTSGKMVINSQFDGGSYKLSFFEDEVALVAIGGSLEAKKYGFIDKTGKFVINPQFDEADNFRDGLACVGVGVGNALRFGFIDKTGKFVINQQFSEACNYTGAGGFSDGLAGVKLGEKDKFGFIDKTGKFVINPQFDKVRQFNDGLAQVEIGNKIGYIDKTGKMVFNPTE